jgi:hypothetical protein
MRRSRADDAVLSGPPIHCFLSYARQDGVVTVIRTTSAVVEGFRALLGVGVEALLASTHRLDASDVPIRRAMVLFREGPHRPAERSPTCGVVGGVANSWPIRRRLGPFGSNGRMFSGRGGHAVTRWRNRRLARDRVCACLKNRG